MTWKKKTSSELRKSLITALEERTMFEPNSGCLIWTSESYGRKLKYGRISFGKGTCISAHRASFSIFIKTIPSGMCVLHKCDTSLCVNPGHLFLGTPMDNYKDMVSKNRKVCLRGEKSASAKIKDKDVIEIRRLYRLGVSRKELRTTHKLSATQIHRIIVGTRFSHLPI